MHIYIINFYGPHFDLKDSECLLDITGCLQMWQQQMFHCRQITFWFMGQFSDLFSQSFFN